MTKTVLSLLRRKHAHEVAHEQRMRSLLQKLITQTQRMYCICPACKARSRIREWSFVQQYSYDRAGWFPDSHEKCPILCPLCGSLSKITQCEGAHEILSRLFREHVSPHTLFKEIFHREGSKGRLLKERMSS